MNKNFILGSGLIGLLARKILGDTWTVIPYYKSRFFSFNPALDDNFIIADDQTDEFVADLVKKKPNKPQYKRGFSIAGQLIKDYDEALCNSWITKLFGFDSIPPQSYAYYKNRLHLKVYDVRLNRIYESLINEYIDELKRESQHGVVTRIHDNIIERGNNKVEYDKIVSTIPLDVLYNSLNIKHNLKAKSVHYYHIETPNLDFEGVNQQLVVDRAFDFYRVTNIAPQRYLFYCHNDINNPGLYFSAFMKDFEIIDGTSIADVIPIGNMPNLSNLQTNNIFCVGSSAQWDWCMDVGSCILRLLKYAGRSYKESSIIKFPYE